MFYSVLFVSEVYTWPLGAVSIGNGLEVCATERHTFTTVTVGIDYSLKTQRIQIHFPVFL